MGLDFFERLLGLVERHRRPGQVIEHTIQTNGTLHRRGRGPRFFAEHGFLVGLSMDGPPDIHDAQRVDKGGAPTHARVLRAARLLAEAGAEFNILCTVHAVNARPRPRGLSLLPRRGRRRLHPVHPHRRAGHAGAHRGRRGGLGQPRPGSPAVHADGLAGDVAGRSARSSGAASSSTSSRSGCAATSGRVFVQMFDVTLANFVGAPSGLCVHSETCGNALAMEHNGDLYSCDHFVEPRYRLGNITRDAPAGPRRLAAAAALRPRQARHAATLLPGVRRALRLPRRLPQGPLPRRPLRRARA